MNSNVEIDWIGQLLKGGTIIWIQVALSVVAAGVAMERFVFLRQKWIVPSGLFRKADLLWKEGRYEEVGEVGAKSKSLFGNIIAFVAAHRDMGFAGLNAVSGDLASAGIRGHLQAAYLLAVVATLQPLLGLLGTVVGMIEAFAIVAQAGSMGDASILADSIAKALVTTAVGLGFAIPSLGLYHYFRLKAGSLGMLLEKQVNEMLVAWMKKSRES